LRVDRDDVKKIDNNTLAIQAIKLNQGKAIKYLKIHNTQTEEFINLSAS